MSEIKGQISFEYLLVSSIALILIFFSLSALFSIKESFTNSLDLLSAKESALSLSNSVKNVCSLGNGNYENIFLKHPLSLDYQNGLIRYRSKSINFSYVSESPCEFLNAQDQIEGLLIIRNENGNIKIEKSEDG